VKQAVVTTYTREFKINNNDRNNGNWGIIKDGKRKRLAPIYDNGNSFSPNIDENKIEKKLHYPEALYSGATNGITAYSIDGVNVAHFRDLLNSDIPEVAAAVKRVVPKIMLHRNDIRNLVDSIPETAFGYRVITKDRKIVYVDEMQIRLEKMLLPYYNRILSGKDDIACDVSDQT
jgi:hypothetical protein